jgi:hypothetical protein
VLPVKHSVRERYIEKEKQRKESEIMWDGIKRERERERERETTLPKLTAKFHPSATTLQHFKIPTQHSPSSENSKFSPNAITTQLLSSVAFSCTQFSVTILSSFFSKRYFSSNLTLLKDERVPPENIQSLKNFRFPVINVVSVTKAPPGSHPFHASRLDGNS